MHGADGTIMEVYLAIRVKSTVTIILNEMRCIRVRGVQLAGQLPAAGF
jgi:hypothetical protein